MRTASLRTIVERSSTLWERLHDPFVSTEDAQDRIAFRRRQWEATLPAGTLQARLKHDGLAIDDMKRGLGPVRLPEDKPLPAWTSTLEQLIDAAGYAPVAHASVPFVEVLSSIVTTASGRLEALSGGFRLLTPEARRQMGDHLLAGLSALCTPAIASEINVARHLKRLQGDSSEQRYQHFLEHRLGSPEPLGQFLTEYPVLARLLAVRIDQWTVTNAEFLERLQADMAGIEACFNHGDALGHVVTLKESFSDPHNGGRSVKALTFEQGLTLLYKPKDLGVDVAFIDLVRWLNTREPSLGLRTFAVLNKGGYGWTEFVRAEPCTSADEVRQYYRRSGMLLGLMHALGTTDSHRENVIAAGASPVLVDMETLLRLPVYGGEDDTDTATQRAVHVQRDSVLSTGLLPEWRFGREGARGVDVSGLSGEGRQESPFLRTTWTGHGTDRLRAQLEHPVLKPLSNQPTLSGSDVRARDHVDAIVSGFEEMYRLLLESRGPFSASSLVSALSAQRLRYLNRPTKEYAMILDRSLDVDSLRDGAHRSLRLELLCRSLLDEQRDRFWPLLASERAALERLDIPYFTASANSRTLSLDGGEAMPDFFRESAGRCLQDRLQRLDDEDMRRQTALIRASFDTRYETSGTRRAEPIDWHEQPPLSRDALLGEAAAVADRLMTHAIRSADGTATWLGIEFIPSVDQYQLQPLSAGLYGGLSGVALFLSALHHSLPDGGYDAAARMVLRGVQSHRRTTRPDLLLRRYGPGGMTGIASVAYAVGWSSRLLDDANWMTEALEWAHLITADAVRADRAGDFMSGVAGTIPALLKLHEWTHDPLLLSRAIECGRQLLAGEDHDRRPSGFAHGTSGIGHALMRLARATGDEDFQSAGARALTRGLHAIAADDHRWCNGRPGDALAMLAVAPDEARETLDALLHLGVDDVDHLCCGTCGRVDVLIGAGRTLSHAAWLDAAARQLAAITRRANARSGFHLMNGGSSPVQSPGLFKGLAGIGYTCLRLADADHVLPSLLLLE